MFVLVFLHCCFDLITNKPKTSSFRTVFQPTPFSFKPQEISSEGLSTHSTLRCPLPFLLKPTRPPSALHGLRWWRPSLQRFHAANSAASDPKQHGAHRSQTTFQSSGAGSFSCSWPRGSGSVSGLQPWCALVSGYVLSLLGHPGPDHVHAEDF